MEMDGEYSYIADNLNRVSAEIESARTRSPYGQRVSLLLASKYADAEMINFAAEKLGSVTIGENRVQQLLEKYDALDKSRVHIHFIGSLQTNKVKYIIDKVELIHSLDSLALAAEIDKRAAAAGKVMDVLVEINIGNEDSKGGIPACDIEDFLKSVSGFGHIHTVGMMTMAPRCGEKEKYRNYFRETYNIFIDISRKKLHNIDMNILSMGMSDSFVPAIEEGATVVRVGSAVFKK